MSTAMEVRRLAPGAWRADVRGVWRAALTGAGQAAAGSATVVGTAALYGFVVLALGMLWRVGAEAAGGSVAGYDAVELVWYVAVAELCVVPVDMRSIERTGDAIAAGAITPERLRPIAPLAVRVGRQYGRTLVTGGACLPVLFVVTLVTVGRPPSWIGVAMALPAVAVALLVNVLGQHAFAAVAFWVRDTRGTWFLYQKLVFVLGGMVLPLEVLPEPLTRVALALPFSAMAYLPARLGSGDADVTVLVGQLGWAAVVAAVAVLLWRAGDRRLQEVGG